MSVVALDPVQMSRSPSVTPTITSSTSITPTPSPVPQCHEACAGNLCTVFYGPLSSCIAGCRTGYIADPSGAGCLVAHTLAFDLTLQPPAGAPDVTACTSAGAKFSPTGLEQGAYVDRTSATHGGERKLGLHLQPPPPPPISASLPSTHRDPTIFVSCLWTPALPLHTPGRGPPRRMQRAPWRASRHSKLSSLPAVRVRELNCDTGGPSVCHQCRW